jgi:pilus assembly protein CpaE
MDQEPNRRAVGIMGSTGPATNLAIGRKVVAIIDDEPTAAALRTGLAALGDDLEIIKGDIRTGIRLFEKETPAHILVVDIAGVGNPQAALDDLSRVCPPDVKVFVIGDSADISFYRLLINELGITEYLTKPVTPNAVRRLLLPHLAASLAEPTARFGRGGQLVAVCGARGGVGTSSIALNLAYEIMGTVNGHVALLDLHVQGGEIALMLSARPSPALRIALENASRVDPLFLERASIEIEPRLRLIASEQAFNSAANVTAAGLDRVLDLLQKKFSFIVADIPMPLPPSMVRVLSLARQVVTVMTPDVASLRDMQNIRHLVAGITGADRMISVLNRGDMQGGLERRLIEKALGAPDIIIPDLGPRMLEAINLGVPAIQKVPALRRHLAPLVREITGVRQPRTGGAWLGRLFSR